MDHVNALLASDIDYFHLRKPDFSSEQMSKYILEIDSKYHYKIMLHRHLDLINEFDLAGINLNKSDLGSISNSQEIDKCHIQPLVVRDKKIEVNGKCIDQVSYSAHSINEARNLYFTTGYVFISPVFDSISKPNYKCKFSDLEALKFELENLDVSIIALGGVTKSRVDLIKDLGFDGYAMLGDFWNDKITTE